MSFAAVSRRPRTLTNYCGRAAMLTRGKSESQCPATGVRLDVISLRQNLISSRARVRGNAIERFARIGYPTLPRKRVGYARRSHENRIAGGSRGGGRKGNSAAIEGVRWERRYERTWPFSVKERKMRIPCAEAELLNIKVSKFRGASKVHSKT